MKFPDSFPVLFGTLLIISAIIYRFAALLITTLKNSKCTLKTIGTIISFEKRIVSYKTFKQPMKTVLYIPIYQYEFKGNTYTFRGTPEAKPLKNIGDQEYLFFDPDKPSRILQQNNNISKILFGFILWVLVGLSFILYGIIVTL